MIKIKTVRVITALIVILVTLLGAACKAGYGTICSFGAGRISFTCPLGFLQMVLASRKLLPQLWLSVVLVLLSIVILGRFFCAWICPAALLRDVFRGKGASKSRKEKREQKGTTWASYSRYAVLGGALLSSFLFGFPVFCAVCPIGLFFGSLFAVNRLFFAQQPSLELLLFPALLALELFVLKSWCRSICPLGALLSIIGSLNRFFRPTIRKDKCLAAQGAHCRVCEKACPEEIDLLNDSADSSLSDCTKCLECYEKCPVKAIKLTL